MDNNKVITEIESNENILIDNSIGIQMDLDKAKYLIEDTLDNYFYKYSTEIEECHETILFLFNKYKTFVESAQDSLNKANYHLEQLVKEQVKENEELREKLEKKLAQSIN